MSILTFGLNHLTAPVNIRERVSVPEERVPEALRALRACAGVEEAAILSTCNRTDLYCGVRNDTATDVSAWFRDYHGMDPATLAPYLYKHRSAAAVRHVMRVASGLDSMVLGEPQILGQLKQAYSAAARQGTLGGALDKLFQRSFAVAKRIRTDTAIGSSPVSVAFAAVSLAKQIFAALDDRTALLVGAGDTIELSARHLKSNQLGKLIIANRTVENAQRLASAFGGYAISLGAVAAHLAEADVVIASTASPDTLITLEHARHAVRIRHRRPILMIDLAVPRNIAPEVTRLEDIYLYTIDDLNGVIAENRQSRRFAARQAEEIIDLQVSDFMGWLGTRDVTDTIRDVRHQAERQRDEVLHKAQRMLARGEPAGEVVEFLAHTLTSKFLHSPTVGIRRAGARAREDVITAARELFRISDAGATDTPPADEDA